ncbi:hypothetical protein NNA36_18390 [Shimia sp. CNT1-13L.2]|uniref:hypothetical protein n=1 Tax=Shimia sp. CNT1-13L.2 TaxID=2959663 RepID=UPI0020CE4B54|nr:hypothetical protein [Shimia sp. CNT1-13L.2]MCP9483936.1 hypothetical protein [Shimia sp. CNT1-13L.2]
MKPAICSQRKTTTAGFAKMALIVLAAQPLAAQTPLSTVFSACEASVVEGSDHRLREIGTLIDENTKGSKIHVDTPMGAVLAVFLSPSRTVSACLLWGRHTELEVEYQKQWQDWVEWEEAADVSEAWFKKAMITSGSVDLTDPTQPGFVVARCSELEHGLVLSSQPVVANAVRQVLPKQEAPLEPVVHYQFSAIAALPGRCWAAVEAHKAKSRVEGSNN